MLSQICFQLRSKASEISARVAAASAVLSNRPQPSVDAKVGKKGAGKGKVQVSALKSARTGDEKEA